VGPYSQAVVAGGWVFASGQIPLDPRTGALVPGDFEAQVDRVLHNLGAVLDAAGSSLARVVRTTVYLADLTLFPRLNEVYARHFPGRPFPARSTIQATRLPLDVQVEIDAIATVGKRPRRAQPASERSQTGVRPRRAQPTRAARAEARARRATRTRRPR
jgi:2-iminobutanoate/2-iminopropanoate deaminase